jgi:ATP-dependent DNA ligase
MVTGRSNGWRIVAYKDGAHVRLRQPEPRGPHQALSPTSRAALAKLSARTLVLDGEVAVFDEQFRSRFEWLREPDPNPVATPPLLMAFDRLP